MINLDENTKVVVEVMDVHKTFTIGNQLIEIIKGISYTVNKGDFVIIFGPSGCGKSTMLNIMLGLERPTTGTVRFLDGNLYDHDRDARSDIRKQYIGMVYQQSNWIKALNVQENVHFPLTLSGVMPVEREKKAMELLTTVEMQQAAEQMPTELSSGQQQRISLARALISDPALVIADEPTGNLDSKASEQIMALFKNLNEKQGKTIIMVTHDLEYLKYATRAINLSDGQVIGEYKKGDGKLKEISISKRGNIDKILGNEPKDGKTKQKSTKTTKTSVENLDNDNSNNGQDEKDSKNNHPAQSDVIMEEDEHQ